MENRSGHRIRFAFPPEAEPFALCPGDVRPDAEGHRLPRTDAGDGALMWPDPVGVRLAAEARVL